MLKICNNQKKLLQIFSLEYSILIVEIYVLTLLKRGETMNLLFSIDDKFVDQLATVLLSIRLNTRPCPIDIYVIQENKLQRTEELINFCKKLNITYHPILVDQDLFKDAPTTDRYPTIIYHRLLAQEMLPADLHKILYLDADTLAINDILDLYNTNIDNYLYASAIHSSITNTTEIINKVRLQNFDANGYYNSGVMLINLDLVRKRVKAQDIFDYIKTHTLLLPDQDVLNALYSHEIKEIPDELYNFDIRKDRIYETISSGKWNLDWVIKNTVILHFCGRDKPWYEDNNKGRLTALYKNYFHLTQKAFKSGR